MTPDLFDTLIGQPVEAIDTPALVIDLDAMGRNLQRMAEFARRHQVRLRPHAKMHKSAQIALLQMQAGAVGVCVQKTDEAEAMAAGGVPDIFISNEVIAPAKLQRVAQVAQTLHARGGRLAIAVDSALGVDRLARAMGEAGTLIDVFVEIDIGQGRCGVPPDEGAVALARRVACHDRLRLAGLHAYHGGAQHLRTPDERRAAIAQAASAVRGVVGRIRTAGLPVPLVTGAGTGTFSHEVASGVWGELQPGSFMFLDADYARNQRDPAQPAFEHALFVRSQVMSRRPGSHAVCDAGHKSHALDSGLPAVHALPGQPELVYANGGDEHGILRPASDGGALPELGDTVWLIPGHCDPTVNLHDFLIGVRGGLQDGQVEVILPVDGRGAVG